MTSRIILGLGLCAISCRGSLHADGIGAQRATREDLDLPLNAVEADKEDCRLGSVEVAGRRFEGDAFVFVVDSSRAIGGCADLSAIRRLVRALETLSNGVNFAIIAFDEEVKRYPARGLPAIATEATREEAKRWIEELDEAAPICPRAALEEALDVARRLGGRSTRIFYYAIEGAICPGETEAEYYERTLLSARRHNPARVPIDAIAVGSPGGTTLGSPRLTSWGAFLIRLALESGGEFTTIPYAR